MRPAASKFENCDCHNVYTSKQPLHMLQETLASYHRSRYEKFSDSNSGRKHVSPQPRGRSPEPSRIPKQSLARILRKNRKLRQFVRKYILKNFTKSSSIHKNMSANLFQRLRMFSYSDNCKRFSLTSKRIKTRCKQNQCKSRKKSPKI